jgi:DivIVA domain-containing protein
MEMSPKAIAAVTFPVVRKGYDPEQVRSFLSQLSRGVEELQNRALQAEAKARLSAAPAPAAAEPAPNMDSITKTLVMAQRTADATLAEAREEADGIRKEASERAESILAEAKAQGAQMIAAAEQEALRTGEVTRSKVAAEVEALETRRSALSDDVDALSGHVTAQREQLASTVLVLNQALEHPGLKDVPKPTLTAPPADPPGPALVPPSDSDAGPATELMGPGGQPAAPGQPDEGDRGFPAPQAAAGSPDPLTQGSPDPVTQGSRDPIAQGPADANAESSPEPATQEVPLVEQGEPQAWSFFDEGPKGDDRWKR